MKLMKKNDLLGEIFVKVVIERAKGDKGEAEWISTLPKVCKDDFQDTEDLLRDKTETKMTLRKDKRPRGGTQRSFIRGGSAPRSNPLPFNIPFFQKRYPFRIPFIEKRHPFHIPS